MGYPGVPVPEGFQRPTGSKATAPGCFILQWLVTTSDPVETPFEWDGERALMSWMTGEREATDERQREGIDTRCHIRTDKCGWRG